MNFKVLSCIVVLVALLAGCGGGGPKADVPIFMMASQGIEPKIGEQLQASLVGKVGQAPTVELITSGAFSVERLIVELAAGGNGIVIVPEQQFRNFANQAGYAALDDIFPAEEYAGGVLELAAEEGKPAEKHLYGIPLDESKWLKEQELDGKGFVAVIPGNAEKPEQAKQVLKVIAEK